MALALALVVGAGVAPSAHGQAPLARRLASALAVPGVDHARSAAVAVDLRTGHAVFVRRPGAALAPASAAKVPVAYALLVTLGPAYRIQTRVFGEGELDGDTWRGDLVLKGYGDPTLSTGSLRRLARGVRALGIRRVTGSVVGDESYFDARRTAPGWKASYYIEESPPLSALVVDRAVYRRAVARRPALAAAALLRGELRAAGVAVGRPAAIGRATSAAVELAVAASPPLARLLRLVNRESDNFAAELLLKHLGAATTGHGTTAAGAAVVRRVLADAGARLTGVRIADGSGLSLLDRLTADALVAVLVAAWNDPLLRGSFLSSLAVSGTSGTLEHRLAGPSVRGRVFAKTGTTSRASTLAGYADARYAFAILHNGPPLQSWWCRRAQDRFVTVLVRAR